MKRLEEPCKCGWKYAGFHFCPNPEPVDPRILRKHGVGVPSGRTNDQMYASFRTDEHRQAMSERANERWERHREKTAERDARIVEIYKEGEKGIKKIGEEFGIAYQTARNVLLRAEMQGKVEIRPQGGTRRAG
jgi:hypothetical protein